MRIPGWHSSCFCGTCCLFVDFLRKWLGLHKSNALWLAIHVHFVKCQKPLGFATQIFMAGVPVKVDPDAEGQAGSNPLVNWYSLLWKFIMFNRDFWSRNGNFQEQTVTNYRRVKRKHGLSYKCHECEWPWVLFFKSLFDFLDEVKRMPQNWHPNWHSNDPIGIP